MFIDDAANHNLIVKLIKDAADSSSFGDDSDSSFGNDGIFWGDEECECGLDVETCVWMYVYDVFNLRRHVHALN